MKNIANKGKMMKSVMLFAALVLSIASASASGRINKIECSGAPKWVKFQIELNRGNGTFQGKGIENYLSYQLNCSDLSASGQIVCESPELPIVRGKKVSAVISFDEDGIASAVFEGVYHMHDQIKIGCIASM